VSSVDTKDQSLHDLTSYATSNSERKNLPEEIEKGQKSGKNQHERLVQMNEFTNMISLSIHNMRKALLKAHFVIVLKELQNNVDWNANLKPKQHP
jgi:hypothetical protein